MRQCFLLDSYSFHGSINTIWQNCAPKIYPLFATTLLDHYQEQGPVLITGDIAPLINDCQTEPANWPGLLITTQATDEELLLHLRNLLLVTYPPESKGVLTYYDKHTATYLFNNTEPERLGYWLGPIQRLEWFGGTWQQEGHNNLKWQCVDSPKQDAEESLEQYASLTQSQQQALTVARKEKYAYDWSQNHKQTYDAAYQYLQEAMGLGFDNVAHLQKYLTLRVQYPNGLIPIQLSGNTVEQRLQVLKNFWHTEGQL